MELGECGVLNGETTDQTSVLLQEVIRTVTNSKQIAVSGVPANRSNMLLPASLRGETPQRQHRADLSCLLFHWVFIVLVIFELLIISILHDHSLHDLEGSLHRHRVKRVFNGLHHLLDWSLIFLVLHLLFKLSSLNIFISGHVSIEDLPLSGFKREV